MFRNHPLNVVLVYWKTWTPPDSLTWGNRSPKHRSRNDRAPALPDHPLSPPFYTSPHLSFLPRPCTPLFLFHKCLIHFPNLNELQAGFLKGGKKMVKEASFCSQYASSRLSHRERRVSLKTVGRLTRMAGGSCLLLLKCHLGQSLISLRTSWLSSTCRTCDTRFCRFCP